MLRAERPKQKTTGYAGGSQKASSVGKYSWRIAESNLPKGSTPHPVPLPPAVVIKLRKVILRGRGIKAGGGYAPSQKTPPSLAEGTWMVDQESGWGRGLGGWGKGEGGSLMGAPGLNEVKAAP